MARKAVRLVLLCEDDGQQRFAHHVFRKLGRAHREVRTLICPAGRGAAEQWVRNRYAEEVRLYRRKATAQKGIGLLVAIDADRQTVDYRHEQLANSLKTADLDKRGPDERIAVWVPKRNIETWVADLLGHTVNEEDDYKNDVRGGDFQPAAARFADRCRNHDKQPAALPSMSRAFDETDRLNL